jgi:hypothetical protein
VAYPSPERYAFDLSHKGRGDKKEGVAEVHHGFHFRKFEIRASPKRWLFSG